MSLSAKHTRLACYLSYISSAAVNNLAPLLFVTFNRDFSLSLEQLASLISVNFGTQILVDFLCAGIADKVGYRVIAVLSQLFCLSGMLAMSFLPYLISPYAGLLVSALLYAVGSGLCEVIISPIIEALPKDDNPGAMSLLHSFYCLGCVIAVVVSTLYFRVFGTESWRYLCLIWSILPLVNALLFSRVPLYSLADSETPTVKAHTLWRVPIFWCFLVLMLCAGGAELAMSQWASFFAETELHVSKQVADLLGPCLFAVTMGLSRYLYSRASVRLDLKKALLLSGILCFISYLLAAFSPLSWLAFSGCALCGFSVGVFWPGVLSLAAKTYPAGGTAMFALLALGGDVGCSSAPALVAVTARVLAGTSEPSVKTGLVSALMFPTLIILTMTLFYRKPKENNR